MTAERCDAECLHPQHVKPLLGRVLTDEGAQDVAETFALLSDASRARILHALSLASELCVCDLAFLLSMTGSAVSHQLRALRHAGVVTRRKDGRIVYYRLDDDHVRHMLSDGLAHVREPARPRRKAASR